MHFIDKYKNLIGIFLVILILIGTGILIWDIRKRPQEEIEISSNSPENGEIVVDVEGAIKKPGIYRLPCGSIVEDVLKKCGGLTKEADLVKIARDMNRAERLRDGQKLYFPFKGAVASSSSGSGSGATTKGKININSAGLSQLDSLPGIGPAYAQRIIDWRVANGGFKSTEEIMEVSGIGEKTYEKIKDLITI